MKRSILIGECAALFMSALAAGQATFQGIGDFPGGDVESQARGVSGDGKVVVGESRDSDGSVAIRWTAPQGMSSLGYTDSGYNIGACDASTDGTFIVGMGRHNDDIQSFRWTANGGTWLSEYEYDEPYAVSADGSAVIGQRGGRAYRWTEAQGMVDLGTFWGQNPWAYAMAVSADGSVVVGESLSPSGIEAFRWTKQKGMVKLGELPGGDYYSSACAISADGKTIMGFSASGETMELFRWTEADGMVGLGGPPPGTGWFIGFHASADCSVLAGYLSTDYPDGYAFVWTEATGARPLKDLLIKQGASEAADWKLYWANGISDDGLTIVGNGTNPDGRDEGWVATLTSMCDADLTGDGILDLFDFLAFVNLFNAADPAADCDDDGALTVFDFLCFTNAFNAGC